jgi:hypothetical protein
MVTASHRCLWFQLLKREYGDMLQEKAEDGFDVTVQGPILQNSISAENFSRISDKV